MTSTIQATAPFSRTAAERIAQIEEFAQKLNCGEALAIPGVQTWIARTKSGRLTIGFGWMSVRWMRGDWRGHLRDHIEAFSDARQVGYFADRNRREIDTWLRNPLAHRLLSRVGATAVQCERDGRSLLDESEPTDAQQ